MKSILCLSHLEAQAILSCRKTADFTESTKQTIIKKSIEIQ